MFALAHVSMPLSQCEVAKRTLISLVRSLAGKHWLIIGCHCAPLATVSLCSVGVLLWKGVRAGEAPKITRATKTNSHGFGRCIRNIGRKVLARKLVMKQVVAHTRLLHAVFCFTCLHWLIHNILSRWLNQLLAVPCFSGRSCVKSKGCCKRPYLSHWLVVGCHRAPLACLLYTSPSPRDRTRSRMPSSA